MAKIDNIKRILKEDFDEKDRPIVDKLGGVINTFMEQVISALNKNINFDNLNQEVRDITVTVDAGGVPLTDVSFRSNLLTRLRGMQVIFAENQTNPNSYPTTCPFISFNENSKIIRITHITGLQASNKYKLRIITIG